MPTAHARTTFPPAGGSHDDQYGCHRSRRSICHRNSVDCLCGPDRIRAERLELARLDRVRAFGDRDLRQLPALHPDRAFDLPCEAARMRRALKFGVGLSVLLLAAGSGYYWRLVREIPVRVAVPEQNVEVRVFGIGTVEAQIVSKVGFQVGGKVVAVKA